MADSTLAQARWIGVLTDANLSGEIVFPVDTLTQAVAIIDSRGTWQDLPGTDGAVLLSESATLALFEPSTPRDSIIDAARIVEVSQRGRPVIRRRGWDY